MWTTASGRNGTQADNPSAKASREWEKLHNKYVEIGRAVNIRQPSTSRKAKTLWKAREAKAKGDENYAQDSEQKIESLVAVREALWEKYLQSPALALHELLRRTAVVGDRADASTAG